ncbi:glutathione S-transferase family protein [Acidisphaera rubrifaciens]|uniref:Glutathione S-transferase n=1 Tax=Acidisphaera rubrifaciens HS-AP3 TaxID=1231350 RepID=A0A0D6P7P3_9PROT|nr:glutathione S-transferase N-terminal domain-containing protein [Acidisphaera rubrifaciens]GAN77366.1 glutathione S-transferase [Acidisphaera rubrifaciens HS-AP3]
MKLFHSPTSPYARKVVACAITRGIDGQIELLRTDPHVSPPQLLAVNPLSRIPCLVTDDGLSLFDSPVICEYLDTVGDALPLFPSHGAQRWRALKFQALADGIMDAAVGRRMEMGRPREDARDALMARHKAAVERALDVLEADPPHRAADIGSIAVACALGYLDLRFAADTWREGHPKLTAWEVAFAEEPGIARTIPAA